MSRHTINYKFVAGTMLVVAIVLVSFLSGFVSSNAVRQASSSASSEQTDTGHVESDNGYRIDQEQLVFLSQVSGRQKAWVFTWDFRDVHPWESETHSEEIENWGDELPVYGFNGDAWWTTDYEIQSLSAFPRISYVNLAYCCCITDSGIAALKDLPNLKTLLLYRNSVRYAGNLIPSGRRKTASVLPTRITDEALHHISEMPELENLSIGDNEFSEAAILQLGKSNSLRHLALSGDQLSDDTLSQLREMLPECEIQVWPRVYP